VKAHCKSYVN